MNSEKILENIVFSIELDNPPSWRSKISSPVTVKFDNNRRGLVVIRIFFGGGVDYLVEFFLVASVGLSVAPYRIQ
jgi:hypothetical protein